MSDSRRWAVASARVVTGLLGITAAVATVGAATLLPWPTYAVNPQAVTVTPTASEQQRVCPGPLLALAADANNASAATSIGEFAAVYATAPSGASTPSSLSRSVEVSPLAAPDNAAGTSSDTPLLLSVPAAEQTPLLGGSQSQTAATETLVGFAAAGCAEASSEAWLVGGSTAVGQTSLVLLSNPTEVAASVDLTVFGESGVIDAPGASGIAVQPNSQRVIPLAGLAPNLNSPVVRVVSRGGQVVASLQQSVIRGLTPGGIDLVGPVGRPNAEQHIVGFVVPPALHDETQSNDTDYHDDQPAVRVLNLGDAPSELSVSVTSDEGGSGTSLAVTLDPGVASEIPLAMLTAGSYTVRLTADQPIVAAARSTEKSETSEDFAWFVASQQLSDESLFSVADGPAPTLRLANPSGTAQKVTVVPDAGAPVTLTVPAAGALSYPLSPSSSYLLRAEAEQGVLATVSYQGTAALASFALTPPGPLAQPIAVYTH